MNKAWIILVACVVIAAGILLGLWYKGGREQSSAYMDVSTGKQSEYAPGLFYHGIKVPGTSFVLFKRYYYILEIDPVTGLTTGVNYEKEGYNQFFVFYKDGSIAASGLCMVNKYDDQILHDVHDLKEAEFFDPDGKLVSSVKNGSGVQTLFLSDGSKFWELHLENFKRRKLTMWKPNGSVQLEKEY